MAVVQIESQGQLQEFLQVLKKRRWQALLPLGFILTLGVCFAVIVPRKYRVVTQVELRENLFDTGERRSVSASTSLREADNAPYQIKMLSRIQSVVEQMKGWTDYMALSPQDRHDYLLDLQEDIEVTMPRRLKTQGSTYVTISFRHTDPRRAFDFLRGLRTIWIKEEVNRDRSRLEEEFNVLEKRREELKKEIAAEERDFAQLRSDYNISPTQPSPSANQVRIEDPVFARLNEHEDELSSARIAEGGLEATIARIREQMEGIPEEVSEQSVVGGVDLSGAILELNADLSRLRSELSSYGRAHSRYGVLQGEIADKEEELEEASKLVSRGEVHETWIENPAFTELKSRLTNAELERTGVHARIDQLETTLSHEREEAEERQDVYREVRHKTAEIARLITVMDELEGRLQYKKQLMDIMKTDAGNPYRIAQEFVEPVDPTEPDPWLIVAISIVLGLAVGLGSAMMSEYSRNCFRGAADISGVMLVPVLGVVNQIRTRGAIRRIRLRRAIVGTSSVLIVLSCFFVTWAWTWNKELLNEHLLASIEEFRGWFE